MRIFACLDKRPGGKLLSLLLCCAALLSLFSCAHTPEIPAQPAAALSGFRNVSPPEAAAVIDRYKSSGNLVILDVRSPEEFRRGHIKGAINIDYYSDNFRQSLAALDREKIYVLYCRTDRRSGEALEIMKGLGFKTIFHMLGGVQRWLADGFFLVP